MAPTGSNAAAAARGEARRILSGSTYTGVSSHPHPLAGVLHAIGHAVESAFDHLTHPITSGLHVAFGNWWPLPTGIIAVGIGVLVAILLVRRRVRIGSERTDEGTARTVPPPDMRQLDAQADDAERAGDHEHAVRLRYRAGLLRLEETGQIVDGDVHTSGELAHLLASHAFDAVTHTHETIVYGGRGATSDDSTESKQLWPEVLRDAKGQRAVGAR